MLQIDSASVDQIASKTNPKNPNWE